MKRTVAVPLMILAASLLTVSCVSVMPKENLGSPDTHVVIFGALYTQFLMFRGEVFDLQMAQINPKAPPMYYRPYRSGELYYIEPVPVGGSWKITGFRRTEGRTTWIYTLGIQEKNAYDPRPEKPGLFFAGSYAYSSLTQDAEGKIVAEPDFHKADTPTELELLQELLGPFGGTSWEPVIKARIEELRK